MDVTYVPNARTACGVLDGQQAADAARAFEGATEIRPPDVAEGVKGGGTLNNLAGEQRPAGPGPNLVLGGLASLGAAGPDEAAKGIVNKGDWRLGIGN